MRRARSTAVQSYLLASVLAHVAIVLCIWGFDAPYQSATANPLEVYPVSENDIAGMEMPAPEFGRGDPLPNSKHQLTPEQLAELQKDRELLPEHHPSPDALVDARGQIVELADPPEPQDAPDDAEYLTRANHRVEEEMASRKFRINSEVVAPVFSNEYSLDHGEDGEIMARKAGNRSLDRGAPGSPEGQKVAALPSGSTKVSNVEPPPVEASASPPAPKRSPTSASAPTSDKAVEAGSETDEPLSDIGDILARKERAPSVLLTSPKMARLDPSLRTPPLTHPYPGQPNQATSGDQKEQASSTVALFPRQRLYGHGGGGGDDGSAPVQLQQGTLKGAPTNDRLQETKGDTTMLNAREFKYFGYMQMIRRLVNFYWSQALDNVGQVPERLTRNEYTSILNVSLDQSGNLESASLVRSCGVRSFDEATLQAFRIAEPFPPPPEGLLDSSGHAVLPAFEFTVTLSRGVPRYSAVDPRANVLFPGIVWPQ